MQPRRLPPLPLPLLLLCLVGSLAAAETRKLIEFGWDEPSTAFLRAHSAEMRAMPFDGCVFHVNYTNSAGKEGNFTWECWGNHAFTREELRNAFADLAAARHRGLSHNFLRFNTTPATNDWFDDDSAILQNARLAGQLAREGGCAGILFDIEHYQGKLFRYRSQRDASRKSWELYASQARRCGVEVMQAFQHDFPHLKVMLTFGYSLPWAQTENGKVSLADCDYGLLAPFLDGMTAAANSPRQLIDGCELAYSYRDVSRFTSRYKAMSNDLLPIVADAAKYRRVFSLGFGLWMDYDWRKRGWDPENTDKNYYTPGALEASLRKALEVTDEYVWLYSEQPRWWSESGKPEKLREEYIQAVRKARSAAATR